MIEIPQPIPFFLNADYLLANKQELAHYNYRPTLIIDRTHLRPFQLLRDDGGAQESFTINSVKLYKRGATSYTELLPYLTFKRYISNSYGYKCNIYEGTDTIPAIPQGYFYLVISDSLGNVWTSGDFKSCFPHYTVKFEFSHPKSFNVFNQVVPYVIEVESKTYGPGEWLDVSEKLADDILNETTTFRKIDELRACSFLADDYTYKAIMFMWMHNVIYLTEETGKRNLIEITSVEATPASESSHYSMLIKYKIPENQLVLTNETSFTFVDYQNPEGVHVPESGIFVGDKKIKVGKKIVI